MKLTIELVPSTSWYTNVRSNVSKKEWDIIRKLVYQQANNLCEICGGRGSKWPVECHEVWEYDDTNHVQKLKKMIALCPMCHKVKHIGRAGVMGEYEMALKHLIQVNNCSRSQAQTYVAEQFLIWEQRSKYDWTLDLSILKEYTGEW